MNGCLKVFTVYVLKQTGIDDTIEIRIIILAEIFPGSRSIVEKKNDNTHLFQDSNDSTWHSREMSAFNPNQRMIHNSFIFLKKIKVESKLSPINGTIRNEKIIF